MNAPTSLSQELAARDRELASLRLSAAKIGASSREAAAAIRGRLHLLERERAELVTMIARLEGATA